jgi:hypothetical protein
VYMCVWVWVRVRAGVCPRVCVLQLHRGQPAIAEPRKERSLQSGPGQQGQYTNADTNAHSRRPERIWGMASFHDVPRSRGARLLQVALAEPSAVGRSPPARRPEHCWPSNAPGRRHLAVQLWRPRAAGRHPHAPARCANPAAGHSLTGVTLRPPSPDTACNPPGPAADGNRLSPP